MLFIVIEKRHHEMGRWCNRMPVLSHMGSLSDYKNKIGTVKLFKTWSFLDCWKMQDASMLDLLHN